MQNASGARENLAQMSQSHRKHFEEVIVGALKGRDWPDDLMFLRVQVEIDSC